MKKSVLSMAIIVSLLLCTNGLQAQNTQGKINQVEFSQQFLGTWKAQLGKDTIMVFNIKSYGKGSERDLTLSTDGWVINSCKMLFGYDEINDKI